MQWARFAILLGMGVFAAAPSFAHDGPEHVIDALTAEMAEKGPSAELLYRRACEFRAFRKYAEAATDLEAALKLDAEFTAARFELARIFVRNGNFTAAEERIAPLTTQPDDALRAAALALRGEIRASQGNAAAAVVDFSAALALHDDVGWYLQRSAAQRQLGDHAGCVDGLRRGLAATESPVLLRALCDGLLDGGPQAESLAEASSIIERELADNRFRSAWLVRRARLRLLRENPLAAEADLRAAINELTVRIDVPRPDPSLLDERSAAYRLLGDAATAEADIAAAAEVRRRIASAASAATPHRHPAAPTQIEP